MKDDISELVGDVLKNIMLGLVNSTEIIGPEHPQTTLFKETLIEKIKQL